MEILPIVIFLRVEYKAPRLLIGHSLGGAAVLGVAKHINEEMAVVTIAAPADAADVAHNFAVQLDGIEKNGKAEVNLAVKHIKVELTHNRDYQQDCQQCENQSRSEEAIIREISYEGELDTAQQARFLEIADICPVHKTLHNSVAVVSKLAN